MKKQLHKLGEHYFYFFCPGCKSIHQVSDKIWTIDEKAVTIRASVLVTAPRPEIDPRRCHSFITNGEIKFLNDCTHELKGQTVRLPEFTMYEDGTFIDPLSEAGAEDERD